MVKNLKKALISLVAIFAFAMLMQTSADAADYDVRQVGCYDNQIVLQ